MSEIKTTDELIELCKQCFESHKTIVDGITMIGAAIRTFPIYINTDIRNALYLENRMLRFEHNGRYWPLVIEDFGHGVWKVDLNTITGYPIG